MPNVFKTTIYLIDSNSDMINEEWINNELHSFADNTDLMLHIAEIHKSGNLEWSDDLAINKLNATTEDYEKYFEWPDVKTFVPGIRPVDDPTQLKGVEKMKIIDVRTYVNDIEIAIHDLHLFRKLGYLCNLITLPTGNEQADYELTVIRE